MPPLWHFFLRIIEACTLGHRAEEHPLSSQSANASFVQLCLSQMIYRADIYCCQTSIRRTSLRCCQRMSSHSQQTPCSPRSPSKLLILICRLYATLLTCCCYPLSLLACEITLLTCCCYPLSLLACEMGLTEYLALVGFFLVLIFKELLASCNGRFRTSSESAPLVVQDLEADPPAGTSSRLAHSVAIQSEVTAQDPRRPAPTTHPHLLVGARVPSKQPATITRPQSLNIAPHASTASATVEASPILVQARTDAQASVSAATARLALQGSRASETSAAVLPTQVTIPTSAVSQGPPAPKGGRSFIEACTAAERTHRLITVELSDAEPLVELATEQGDTSPVLTSASAEASNLAGIVKKRRRKERGAPLKLIWSHFDLPDSYMFNRKPFSSRKMAHTIALSSNSHDNIFAQRLDVDSRGNVNKVLANFPSLLDKPVATFNAPELLVSCSNEHDLAVLFRTIEDTRMLGPYYAKIKSKGLPFAPAFWIIRDLPMDLGKNKLRADIQSYIVKNEATLGKWRVVYASWEFKSDVHVSRFNGEVVIVTDAETIRRIDGKATFAFHGCEPERLYSLQNLPSFSVAN